MTVRRNTASRGSTDRQAEIQVVSEAATKVVIIEDAREFQL